MPASDDSPSGKVFSELCCAGNNPVKSEFRDGVHIAVLINALLKLMPLLFSRAMLGRCVFSHPDGKNFEGCSWSLRIKIRFFGFVAAPSALAFVAPTNWAITGNAAAAPVSFKKLRLANCYAPAASMGGIGFFIKEKI